MVEIPLPLIVGASCLAFLCWWHAKLTSATIVSEVISAQLWRSAPRITSETAITPSEISVDNAQARIARAEPALDVNEPAERPIAADAARELLSRFWFFAELSQADVSLVVETAQKRRYEGRRAIVRQGDADGDLYAVLRGHLKVAVNAEGKEIVTGFLQAGDVFGEITFLDAAPRSVTVSSLDSCELLVLRRADFLLLLRRAPTLSTAMMNAMSKRIRRLSESAQDTAFLQAKSRLAQRLIELADEVGTPLGPGQVALKVRFSDQELADMAQATRENVNSVLRQWAQEGIIQRDEQQMAINLERLAKS